MCAHILVTLLVALYPPDPKLFIRDL
jgi:hypothetical protein